MKHYQTFQLTLVNNNEIQFLLLFNLKQVFENLSISNLSEKMLKITHASRLNAGMS